MELVAIYELIRKVKLKTKAKRTHGVVLYAHCRIPFANIKLVANGADILGSRENMPGHLACSACGTPQGESGWVAG